MSFLAHNSFLGLFSKFLLLCCLSLSCKFADAQSPVVKSPVAESIGAGVSQNFTCKPADAKSEDSKNIAKTTKQNSKSSSQEYNFQEVLSKLQTSYDGFNQLTAVFVQQSHYVGLNKSLQSKGRVYFKKPGKMDWEYLYPEEQKFIADGKTLWFFQPDLNQVTIGDFENAFVTSLPVSFLLGVGKISTDFDLLNVCSTNNQDLLLSFSSKKEDPNLSQFFLLVTKDNYFPIGARIVDVGGNDTAIFFESVDTEKEVKDEKFNFKIPSGVDVIDKRSDK